MPQSCSSVQKLKNSASIRALRYSFVLQLDDILAYVQVHSEITFPRFRVRIVNVRAIFPRRNRPHFEELCVLLQTPRSPGFVRPANYRCASDAILPFRVFAAKVVVQDVNKPIFEPWFTKRLRERHP